MTDIFRVRLREERLRIDPRQREFAQKIGVKQSTLSEWETKAVSMKFEHLAMLASAGIDITYVFTGRRGSNLLSTSETLLLESFRRMDNLAQEAIVALADRAAIGSNPKASDTHSAAAALHSPSTSYRAPEPDDLP